MLEHIPGAVGLDEAGRGPLAGPVVAAAVLLPDDFDRKGLNDSKQLVAEERERLFGRIKNGARWEVSIVDAEEIDALNILRASMEAMRRAYFALNCVGSVVLVDGNQSPPGISAPIRTVVKGDGKFASIAAASIVAKVTRDRLMIEMAQMYPEYGFDTHFGYPTPAHLETLKRYGPCPIHRRSFAPVRNWNLQPALAFDDL